MILNIGAIKYCLEQYKSHATYEKLDIPDEHYKEAIQTLKEIEIMLIERVAATYSRDQLVERIKHTKIQELKTRLKDASFEDVIGDLLEQGFYPLADECETVMSEMVGRADQVILL
jgi:hypothetical protein